MNFEEYENDKKKTYEKVQIHELINFENNEEKDIKVSIVIPIFNVETFLPQCLDSVLNQTLEDIEIICVNDGSTDNSFNILKDYLSKDKRIKIINKDNAGYGHTMNIGMDMASGEYIGIVESDDYILPKMLEVLYDKAENNELDFVKSDYYRFFGEGEKIYKNYFKIDESELLYNKIISTSKNHDSFKVLMNTWTGLYKTSFLRKNNIRHNETPGASYQDNGFWIKTLFYGERVMFVPEAFYMYRRDNPNSSVKNKEKVYAMDYEYELIDNFLESANKKDEFNDVITYAKYHNFHFTMDRIDMEFKEEFLNNTANNFRNMRAEGTFNPSLLEEIDQRILNWIMNNTSEYYNYMYTISEDNYDYLKKYLEARIDIKNYGSEDNDIILIDCDDILYKINRPSWFKDSEGIGNVIYSIKEDLDLTFKCVGDGELKIEFKGKDYYDLSNNRIPLFIDYTEIIINDENILTGSMVTWHDNPFTYKKNVKNGQKINIKVKWLPMHEESNLEISPKTKISDLLSRCRIDIRNKGNEENNIVIIDNDDIEAHITQPKWFKDKNGVGTVVDSDNGELSLSFKCIKDGKLDIKFKGMDFKDENENRIPIYIDYNEIFIDDKPIITENTSVWHDNPIIYEQEVKNNQIVSLKVKWSASESSKDLSDNDEKNLNSDDMTINELISKINTLKRENKKLKDFNDTILNSNSWKMTNVLRKIKQLK